MTALRVKNITRGDLVWIGDDHFIIPGEVIELRCADLLHDEGTHAELRRLVDAGMVRVLDDPPEPVH